ASAAFDAAVASGPRFWVMISPATGESCSLVNAILARFCGCNILFLPVSHRARVMAFLAFLVRPSKYPATSAEPIRAVSAMGVLLPGRRCPARAPDSLTLRGYQPHRDWDDSSACTAGRKLNVGIGPK